MNERYALVHNGDRVAAVSPPPASDGSQRLPRSRCRTSSGRSTSRAVPGDRVARADRRRRSRPDGHRARPAGRDLRHDPDTRRRSAGSVAENGDWLWHEAGSAIWRRRHTTRRSWLPAGNPEGRQCALPVLRPSRACAGGPKPDPTPATPGVVCGSPISMRVARATELGGRVLFAPDPACAAAASRSSPIWAAPASSCSNGRCRDEREESR